MSNSPLNRDARKVGKREKGQHAQRLDETIQTALRQSSRAGRKPVTFEWDGKRIQVVATRLDQVTQQEIVETVERVKRERGIS